jgi:hypothetical protein
MVFMQLVRSLVGSMGEIVLLETLFLNVLCLGISQEQMLLEKREIGCFIYSNLS